MRRPLIGVFAIWALARTGGLLYSRVTVDRFYTEDACLKSRDEWLVKAKNQRAEEQLKRNLDLVYYEYDVPEPVAVCAEVKL